MFQEALQPFAKKPEDRPSAAQLLAHDWLKEDEAAGPPPFHLQ